MHNPAPTSLEIVLSPAWLSWALSASGQQTRVARVAEVVERQKTQADKIRFSVEYEAAPAGASPNLCVKGFFDGATLIPRLQRNCVAEIGYYRDLAGKVGVQVPNCRYAGLDPDSGHGLLLMDDVVAAGGRFFTALEAYSVDQAASTLEQIARLHAPFWGGRGLDEVVWLTSRLAERFAQPPVPMDTLQEMMDGPRGDPLPAKIKSAERLLKAGRALVEPASREPECVVHGDAHAGNLFELHGRPGLVDWQVLQRSSWALDVAYHLGAALSVEERRRSESALLKHYLDRLAAYGAEPPGWDDAWRAYRTHMTYGYYMWCITRLVTPPVIMEFVRRLGLAVEDLESFELLGA